MRGIIFGVIGVITLLSVNNANNVYNEYGSSTGHFYYEECQNLDRFIGYTVRDIRDDRPSWAIKDDLEWIGAIVINMTIDKDYVIPRYR